MHKEVARLATLLAFVTLATSRFGLLAHELLGHGVTALALGGNVIAAKLFWFAGGWIRYRGVTEVGPALAIAMGGIAVEAVVGTAMWCLLRGDTLGRRIARAIGAAIVVHAGWYLATGAWHGYGDGVLLYRVLGDARAIVAIAAGLVTCGAAWLGAREVFGVLVCAAGGVGPLLVALVIAGGVNAALAVGELRVRRDATYADTMASERDRTIAGELARYQAERPDASAAERAEEQQRIERAHRTFPFAWLLGACVAAAGLAGAVRPRRVTEAVVTRRQLAFAAVAGATGLALVIVLDAVL